VWLPSAIFQRIANPAQHRKLIKAPTVPAASRLAIAGRQAALSPNAKESEPQTQDCRPIKKRIPAHNRESGPPCEIAGASADTLTISGFSNYTFIGITDSCPITSLTFHDINNPDTEIDIISPESGVIGLPTPAPEPATLALTLLGGAGLLLIRRRK
jgi:hypothetical protein